MRLFIKDIKVDIIQPSTEVGITEDLRTISYGDFNLKCNGTLFITDLRQKELRKLLMVLVDNDCEVKSLVLQLRKNVCPVKAITKQKFKLIEAGGGIVQKENKALYIHRIGKWDLPKGKLEKGETIEQGALREVFEECNVEATINSHLMDTFHVHKYKEKYRLKKTYWSLMDVVGNPILKPQLEEDIDEVCWLSNEKSKKIVFKDTYNSLKPLLKKYYKLNQYYLTVVS